MTKEASKAIPEVAKKLIQSNWTTSSAWTKSAIAVATCLGMSLTPGIGFADDLPHDLSDLVDRFEQADLTEVAPDYIRIKPEQFLEADQLGTKFLTNFFDQELVHEKDVSNFRFLRTDDRDQLLELVFPAENSSDGLCRAVPESEVKPRPNEDPAAYSVRKTKSSYSKCKKELHTILGGILHARPEIYAAKVSYADSSKESMWIYVRSVMTPSTFLKYELLLNDEA